MSIANHPPEMNNLTMSEGARPLLALDLNAVHVGLDPVRQVPEVQCHFVPHRAQFVLNPRRAVGRDVTTNETVFLEHLERLGQHLVADASNEPSQLIEPASASR